MKHSENKKGRKYLQQNKTGTKEDSQGQSRHSQGQSKKCQGNIA